MHLRPEIYIVTSPQIPLKLNSSMQGFIFLYLFLNGKKELQIKVAIHLNIKSIFWVLN